MLQTALQTDTIAPRARDIGGVGVGLRTPHIPELLDKNPTLPWLEILADNWLVPGGLTRDYLLAVCERYPTTLHGVGLSLGATTPLDFDYLQKIKTLQQQTGAVWYSEHCSFSHASGEYIPDLLPMPYNDEAINHISERIRRVQDFLGQRILLENVSSYIEYNNSDYSEATFLNAIVDEADCYLLLDINNVYVTAYNQLQNPLSFFKQIHLERVKEIHLAGFDDKQDYLLDAHNNPVADPVWTLYESVLEQMMTQQLAPPATLIEWDNDLPTLDVLLAEQRHADTILQQSDCAYRTQRESTSV
jgi:uncharacterized protein